MTHQLVIQLLVAYTLTGAFIFTVIVTCLSIVGWVKFADPKQQSRLFHILIVELVVIGVAFFGDFIEFNPKLVAETAKLEEAKKIRYTVNVLDQLDNSGVDAATLALAVGTTKLEATTDKVGIYTFVIDESLSGAQGAIRVAKSGYRGVEITNPIPPTRGTLTFRLERVTAPTPQPVASTPSRVSDIAVFPSGAMESGTMANFSQWYELCTGALPTGSVIDQVAFTLSGDRTCGAWAECREKERTPTRVCWEFRMQGHNEWRPPGQARSEGQLRVQFSRPVV